MAKTVEQLEGIYQEMLDILVRHELSINEVCYVLKLLDFALIEESVKQHVRSYTLKHNR